MKTFDNFIVERRELAEVEALFEVCLEGGMLTEELVDKVLERAIMAEQNPERKEEITKVYVEIWNWLGNAVGSGVRNFTQGFKNGFNPQSVQPPVGLPANPNQRQQQLIALRHAYAALKKVGLGDELKQVLQATADRIIGNVNKSGPAPATATATAPSTSYGDYGDYGENPATGWRSRR